MTDPTRGTDRGGRRAKKFLTPLQKYEVFLQLVRQEVTVVEAAEPWQVDRGVIMRIRTVAKEGVLEALANSHPGRRAKERDFEMGRCPPGQGVQPRRSRRRTAPGSRPRPPDRDPLARRGGQPA